MAYRVMIYRASCAEACARSVAPLILLADLDRQVGEPAGDPTATPVAVATTAVLVALVDLLATRHVVAVFDHAADCVACGAIGGDLQRGDDGRPTNLFFGLAGTQGAGYGGVAWFLAQPDGTTTSTIFLAREAGGRPTGPKTREDTWPAAFQTPGAPLAAETDHGVPTPTASRLEHAGRGHPSAADDGAVAEGRGGINSAMEIAAGAAMVVAVVASSTLGAREWGEWNALWRPALATILATPVGHGVAFLVLTPVFWVLARIGLWPFLPGSSAYNTGSLLRVLAALWCCWLVGDSLGWI